MLFDFPKRNPYCTIIELQLERDKSIFETWRYFNPISLYFRKPTRHTIYI